MINISNIINDKNLKKSLPTQFSKTEQISTVYTLTKTTQSKIQVIRRNQVYFSSSNVSTETTVIVKD